MRNLFGGFKLSRGIEASYEKWAKATSFCSRYTKYKGEMDYTVGGSKMMLAFPGHVHLTWIVKEFKGNCYVWIGKPETSIVAYFQTLGADPKFFDGKMFNEHKGKCYVVKGTFKELEGKEKFQKLLERFYFTGIKQEEGEQVARRIWNISKEKVIAE